MLAEIINSQNNFKYSFYDFTQLSSKLNFYMDDSWRCLQLFILNVRLKLICYFPSCHCFRVNWHFTFVDLFWYLDASDSLRMLNWGFFWCHGLWHECCSLMVAGIVLSLWQLKVIFLWWNADEARLALYCIASHYVNWIVLHWGFCWEEYS